MLVVWGRMHGVFLITSIDILNAIGNENGGVVINCCVGSMMGVMPLESSVTAGLRCGAPWSWCRKVAFWCRQKTSALC
jgi:hypothetical protein